MNLDELMKIVVRELAAFDGLIFEKSYESVIIKMDAPRHSFSYFIFRRLVHAAEVHGFVFYVHDDVIYLYCQN